MIPLYKMKIIQIDITNACINRCSNCTRLIGHHRKPFFMDMDQFCRAVDSLVDFPGMVGIIGGEPLMHPLFKDMVTYLEKTIKDPERRGLWSTIPKGTQYGSMIKRVFGNLYLNDHAVSSILHQPVLVAAREVVSDEQEMWSMIDKCWVQNLWSASITPKGAFFCEVAAAFDMLFDGPGGWEVVPGWWRREPHQFTDQKELWCSDCGCSVPLNRRSSIEGIDDVSAGNLERLKAIDSPKARQGLVQLYKKGLSAQWKPDYNWYMDEVVGECEYRDRIKARLEDAV
ncbi:MAG: radical SAM protein [Planctomycetes bacterium]|nr:radical SAM protein [Planctomycetota bacterium]